MKTVTGLFDAYAQAEETVAALKMTGIATDDITIMARGTDDKDPLAIASKAAGGVFAALMGADLSETHQRVHAEGVARGGVVVLARIHDDREGEVKRLMARHGAADPDEKRQAFLDDGWQDAEAQTLADAAAPVRPDRSSYRAQVARP